MTAGQRRDERGMVAGGEALAFGTLVLLAGALVLVNVWSVIETRTAVDAAAREYLRTYTRSDERNEALGAAERAARITLAARATPLRGLRIVEPAAAQFGPCGRAEVTLIATVPAARLPFVGEVSATEVTVTHAELLGPHEEVTPHDRFDDRTTLCDGP
jgi:hypothetical protein